jgi:hypothetical protein
MRMDSSNQNTDRYSRHPKTPSGSRQAFDRRRFQRIHDRIWDDMMDSMLYSLTVLAKP